MRIISGKWKGRKLVNLENELLNRKLRPTLDRARETVFNILSHGHYSGSTGVRVLDLFSGTGAMGFEALSRGAKKACFIDNDPKSVSIIKKNVKLLSAERYVTIMCIDATNLDKNVMGEFDLVFLDPPYGLKLGEASLKSAIKAGWIASGATIVWEESSDIPALENIKFLTERSFGKTKIQISSFENKPSLL